MQRICRDLLLPCHPRSLAVHPPVARHGRGEHSTCHQCHEVTRFASSNKCLTSSNTKAIRIKINSFLLLLTSKALVTTSEALVITSKGVLLAKDIERIESESRHIRRRLTSASLMAVAANEKASCLRNCNFLSFSNHYKPTVDSSNWLANGPWTWYMNFEKQIVANNGSPIRSFLLENF